MVNVNSINGNVMHIVNVQLKRYGAANTRKTKRRWSANAKFWLSESTIPQHSHTFREMQTIQMLPTGCRIVP